MKRILHTALFCFLSAALFAQDIHFSQFYNMPVWLNPAMTGMVDGNWRVAAIYRNQWWAPGENFANPVYNTPGISFDAPIKIGDNALGIGGLLLADRLNGGMIQDLHAGLSLSYIQSLGYANRHKLSFGLQGTYQNRQFDQGGMQFASQFSNNVFVPTLPGETFANETFHTADVQAGLAYSVVTEKEHAIQVGAALYNIARVDRSYLAQGNQDDHFRYTAHGSFQFMLGRSKKWSIIPSLLFMHMAKTNQMNSGLGLSYAFSESFRLVGGPYLRSNGWVSELAMDAIIGYLGFETNGFRMGMSYDHTLSGLQEATGAQGGMEVSVQYVHRNKNAPKGPTHLFCPRF